MGVMHEGAKLSEARHFLNRMSLEHNDAAAYGRELSAFLGASRSVLQYALVEAETKRGEREWYRRATADPLLSFFKDLRNDNVHSAPVAPLARFKTERQGLLNVGDDDDEFLIPYPHDVTRCHYECAGRPGEDAMHLSRQYLSTLEAFVDTGVALGWISG